MTGGRDGFGLAALVFGLLAFAVDVMDPEGFRLVSALPLGAEAPAGPVGPAGPAGPAGPVAPS